MFLQTYRQGAETVQLVERPTEKPSTILTRVRVPGATRDFLKKSTSSADSLTVFVQPRCAIACINSCALTVFVQPQCATACINSCALTVFVQPQCATACIKICALTVFVQPQCACINSCAHVKNADHWQPHHCLNRRKYATHW